MPGRVEARVEEPSGGVDCLADGLVWVEGGGGRVEDPQVKDLVVGFAGCEDGEFGVRC